MESFKARAKLYKSESERFQEYPKSLLEDSWGRQSACHEWRVEDVVAHLVDVVQFYAGTVARGVQGESSPPGGRPEAGTGHASLIAAKEDESAIADRERLGDRLLATYIEKDNHIIQLLTGLSPEDQVKPCYHTAVSYPPEISWIYGSRKWSSASGTSAAPSREKRLFPPLVWPLLSS